MKHLATRFALAFSGAGLAVAGVVLLLRAVWIAIAAPLGAMWASTIMGAVLLLAGGGIVAWLVMGTRGQTRSGNDLIVALTTAFLQGFSAGRSAHRQ